MLYLDYMNIIRREGSMAKSREYQEIVLRLVTTKYFDFVRKNTEEIARNMGFDEDQVFDLALVVDEAYVNAIEHGAEGKNESKLEVKFLIYKDKLEIIIQDGGCGFDMNKVSADENLVNMESTRGRGLGLMKLLTDEFYMQSFPGQGTTVRFAKHL